jgi:hypothetical protein
VANNVSRENLLEPKSDSDQPGLDLEYEDKVISAGLLAVALRNVQLVVHHLASSGGT